MVGDVMPIPLVDLGVQYRAIKAEVDAAVIAVLESGQFVLGYAVKDFETMFSRVYGIKHAIACSSGTAALHMALKALDIGRGDEVITTAMTFIATASAIDLAGARAILTDIDPITSTIDAAAVERAITPRTKAIVPVHLYGQCADMEPLLAIGQKYGVPVIEDAAQAHGAKYQNRVAGTMGHISCFSFYPGKNLGAYGEGGLVATSDDALATKIRMLRDWGQDRRYHHPLKGFNYRMDGVQGAVLGVKMKYIEDWTSARRRIAAIYHKSLSNVGSLELPIEATDRYHVWHVYGVRVPGPLRQAIVDYMSSHDIATGFHYPVAVHMQPCFSELGYKMGDFPQSESHADRELSLPIYPEMTEIQVNRVVTILRQAMEKVGHA